MRQLTLQHLALIVVTALLTATIAWGVGYIFNSPASAAAAIRAERADNEALHKAIDDRITGDEISTASDISSLKADVRNVKSDTAEIKADIKVLLSR